MQTKNIITSIKEYPLPNTSDLERQLLADIVASPEAIGDVMRFVAEDSFTNDERKGLWRAALNLFNRGEVVDMTTMLNVCGDDFVNECIVPGKIGDTERMAVQHAIHLRHAAARRRAYFAAVEMLRASMQSEKTTEELCTIADGLSREVQGEITIVNEVPLQDILREIKADIKEQRRLQAEGKSFRVPTGFPALDWNTYGGWLGGQLIVLAARPSVGKTALMMKLARAASQGGFPVSVFSIEMTRKELAQRLLFSTGMVSPLEMCTARISDEQLEEACALLEKHNIGVNDLSRNVEEIIARMSIQVRAGKCRVAFIDYLGLMNIATSWRENASQAIGRITSELKATAKRLNIPIILLCQLNRDAAKGDRAPELYDLRDSGSIEQDADIVLMLENEEAYNPETGLRDINIWIRKNRQYKRDVCIRVSPNKTYSDFKEVGVIDNPEIAAAAMNGSGSGDGKLF